MMGFNPEDDTALDFIHDGTVGHVLQGTSEERPEEAAPSTDVTNEEYVGEEGPKQDDGNKKPEPKKPEDLIEGLVTFFKAIFAPKEVVPMPEGTGEFPGDSTKFSQADALLDAVRYLGTAAMKVTETPARFIKFYKSGVGVTPTQLAGFQPNRKSLVIENTGSNSVFLGDSASVTTDSGWELATNTSLEINSQAEVWAIAAADGETTQMKAEHYA